MDPRDVAVAPLRAAVERKRQEKRQMKVSLRVGQVAVRVKARERAKLRRNKTALLAKEAAKQKLVDDFMVFLEANEQNGAGNARDFDEKSMKDAILTLMTSDDGGHSGDNGGLVIEHGDRVHETGPDIEEKATADVIVAKKDSDDGDNNDGLSGDNGGNAAPETAKNLGEEATMAAVKGTKSDGNTDDGGEAGGWGVVAVTSRVITIVVLVLVLLGWLLLES